MRRRPEGRVQAGPESCPASPCGLAPFALRDLAPFAAEVVALDETTLDPVARKLPSLRGLPKADRRLLPGKLAGLFDLRRQQWMKIVHIAKADQNEKVLAMEIAGRAQVDPFDVSMELLVRWMPQYAYEGRAQ